MISFSLQYLQMSPENVPHEERSSADEVLFVHAAQLVSGHGETGDETVNMSSTAQAELSDGPGQPVTHMLL